MLLIKTVFFNHLGEVVKTNSSKNHNAAIMYAQNNMLLNVYGADVAEITDSETSELYATITRSKSGKVTTETYRDPRNYMDPIRRSMHSLLSF